MRTGKTGSYAISAGSRQAFAGQFSPDTGTNVFEWREYCSDFPGPNSLDRAHRAKAVWVHDRLDADQCAEYYAFSLNTTVPSTTPFVPAFRRACERATRELFPSFSRRHPDRHDPECSVGAVVLPAVSASGRHHFHGWIRNPYRARQTPERLQVSEHGLPRVIVVPLPVAAFVRALIEAPDAPYRPLDCYRNSLWIANRDGRATNVHRTGFGLKYLLMTADEELRRWNDVEFIPTLVFSRLNVSTEAPRLHHTAA